MDSALTNVATLILIGAVIIPIAVYLLLGLGERIVQRLPRGVQSWARPWTWLLLPLLLMAAVLAHPFIETIINSFRDSAGEAWVGWDNFAWSFSPAVAQVLWNNIIWLIVYPAAVVLLALVAAVLFDRVRYEKLAMSILLLPTAISFAAASIIWRQIYSYQPSGKTQKGLLNALWTLVPGNTPVAWLQTESVNTYALIFVGVWCSLGIAALILSAAVKSVPGEYVEAARLDGAGELRIFASITLPHIGPTLLVVVTTQVIFALKIFDIVYVMTNGNYNTDTIANRMYYEIFAADNLGHASAIAVLLLVAALPVVFLNIRRFRTERGVES